MYANSPHLSNILKGQLGERPPEQPYGSEAQIFKAELGVTPEEAAASVQARELITDPVERGKMGGRGHKASNNITSFRGTDPTYALARLKRDRPDLLERVKSGELSPHAAAVEAGFRKKTFTIPADPQKAAAALRRHFDDAQWELFLEEIEAL